MNTLRSFDGLELFTETWPLPKPRGTVLLVHGHGEHIGRYAHVAEHLNTQGWQAMGFDHRGHGRSPGARGDVPTAEALLQDLAAALDSLPEPGPRVLLGHSMGGAIAARFVAEELMPQPAAWHRPVDALVLSSPALAVNMNAFQKALLAFGERFAPGLQAGNGLKPAWVSRDPAVVAAYQADPQVHDRITPRLARFIIDAGTFARTQAPQWRTPTLLMWAGADRCVPPSGSEAFAATAPQALLTPAPWPGLFHEIFNEPERAQVLHRLGEWLDTRFPRKETP